jgi:hypothetical protein
VGVEGREDGVCTELDAVAVLATDKRDCGRRAPGFIVLCARILLLLLVFLSLGNAEEVEAAGRNAPRVVGLEGRRLVLPMLSCSGEESSIIKTQPDVSNAGDFLRSDSTSKLCLSREDLLDRPSKLDLAGALLEDEEMLEGLGIDDCARALAFGRPVRLPIRRRGTRV